MPYLFLLLALELQNPDMWKQSVRLCFSVFAAVWKPWFSQRATQGDNLLFLQTFFCVFITKGEVLQDLFREW